MTKYLLVGVGENTDATIFIQIYNYGEKMPIIEKKQEKQGPNKVNVAQGQVENMATMQVPKFQNLNQKQMEELEEQENKEIVATCDFTGTPIFDNKNINVLQNTARPELNGLVICTKVLRMLIEASGNTNVKIKSTKKAKS